MEDIELNWRTPRRSGNGGNCVELASSSSAVYVRDSKAPDAGKLAFDVDQWRLFTDRIKATADV